MHRLFFIVTLCGLLIGQSDVSAGEDVVTIKLTDAKENFDKILNKARFALLASLKKKEDSAQKSGDLQTLESLKRETQDFKKVGKLPTSVPVGRYVHQILAANARLKIAYGEAIKQYTKEGGIELARAVQQQLEALEKSEEMFAEVPDDAFQVDSVWIGENPAKILKVIEREDESFAAHLVIGDRVERVVIGTIQSGEIIWLSKDVRPIRGNFGGDNHGTLCADEIGEKIDFAYRNPNGSTGAFTLRLSKPESKDEKK